MLILTRGHMIPANKTIKYCNSLNLTKGPGHDPIHDRP
jgi:hypothetical protein